MYSPCILLIDDHAMFRTGLSLVIKTALPSANIVQAGSFDEVMLNTADNVDMALLDIKLNGLSGLECIALLKRKWPATSVLMLSSHDEPETVRLAMARGADGFVSKADTAEKIIEAIYLVLHGQFAELSPGDAGLAPKSLTPRQCEVLNLLHQGLSNKLIARQLSLSDNTVRRHVQDILEFFQVASRAEAAFAARRQGLVG